MKTISKFRYATVLATAFAAVALTGCVDEDYSLEDVDMTVGLGSNLTLPSNNNTEGIALDDVLDLGTNNFLKVSEDGMYNIDVLDDESFTAHMWVDEFYIPSKTYQGSYTINLGEQLLKVIKKIEN